MEDINTHKEHGKNVKFSIEGDNSQEKDKDQDDKGDAGSSQKSKSRFKVAKVDFATDPMAREGTPASDDSGTGTENEDGKSLNKDSGHGNERGNGHVGDSYQSQTYDHDTHNLKTFGQNTLETLPHLDHYRNLLSATTAMKKRPTLLELHEMDKDDNVNGQLLNEAENGALKVTPPAVIEDGKPPPTATKFGWVQGVLVRCLLNIYGVMLFLRLSWVIGQAGLWLGAGIVLLSAVVTVITTLSMSAICTNGEIKGGGAYFMISRSLGPEFGGSIGLIFSLANAVAVAMYVVGFAETIRDILKEFDCLMVDEINDVRIIGVLTLCALLGIAMLGMEWEAKAQVGLLVILIIALINFTIGSFIPPTKADQAKGFVGYQGEVFKDNMGPDFREGESFFSVFSVFFPAATGILAGANISGDLADAQKAIPKGTLLAILITTITYIFMGWIAGACVLRDAPGLAAEFLLNNDTQLYNITSTMATYTYSAMEAAKELVVERASNATVCENPGDCAFGLHNDMQVMRLISGFGPITIAGIISATLSSALASLVSAPKVFQAVCKDKIFPGIHVFAKGYGKAEEPRLAYLLTFVIAIGCICIGSLNAIAPLISNFFLMSYALINYSCFDASLAKSPGWRPAFQFYSMWIALIGALLCLGVMFVINWWTALITFVLVAFFYIYTLYRKPDINWGSSTQAHVYRNALQHTMKLVSVMEHVKNFRPQVLCLSGFPSDRTPLVDFGSSISKNISLMICGHIIIGEPSEHLNDMRKMSRLGYLWLHKRKVKSFYTAVIAKNLREGTQSLLQAAGLGKLRPNMVLMGFKSDWQTADPRDVDNYFHIVHDTFDLHYGVGILRLKDGICTDQSTSEAVHVVEEAVSEENINEGSPLKANRESHDSLDLLDVNQDASGWESNCELSENEMDVEEELGKDKKEQKEEKKKRFKINKEVLKSVNYFSRKQKKGTIDVYWLFDDGGLTLLIPYILTMKRQWSGCHLRVFIAGTKKGELDRDQRHMATLLSKFRIEYSSMTVIPDLGKRPHQDRVKQFEELTKDWIMDEEKGETKESHPWKIPANDYQSLKDKTYRHIRCRELLEQYSMESTLVVMTLPMPRKGLCPSSLYMAWIEYLTKDLPPPILLVRGNQDNVLTFYS